MRLYTFIKEPMDPLDSLRMDLFLELHDTGLESRYSRGTCGFLRARAVDTRGLGSGIIDAKPTIRRLRRDRAPRFDATDLCEKFKDIVWGKGVHLDRLCISELGPEEILEDEQWKK